MGHFRDTRMAVCSTPSSPFRPAVPGTEPMLKFLFTERRHSRGHFLSTVAAASEREVLLLVTQCSAGSSLFFIRPWSTERTDGRWTSCMTKRWDCREHRLSDQDRDRDRDVCVCARAHSRSSRLSR